MPRCAKPHAGCRSILLNSRRHDQDRRHVGCAARWLARQARPVGAARRGARARRAATSMRRRGSASRSTASRGSVPGDRCSSRFSTWRRRCSSCRARSSPSGAGVVFGLVRGFVIVSISATLGATAAFLVGRYLARAFIAAKIEGHPKFAAIDEAVAREGWKIVALLRLSPVVPFNVLNYAFGVTRVSLRDYVVASWIGMMPGTLLYVYLGSIAGDLAGAARPGEPHPRRVGVLRRGPPRDGCRDRVRDAPGSAGARRARPPDMTDPGEHSGRDRRRAMGRPQPGARGQCPPARLGESRARGPLQPGRDRRGHRGAGHGGGRGRARRERGARRARADGRRLPQRRLRAVEGPDPRGAAPSPTCAGRASSACGCRPAPTSDFGAVMERMRRLRARISRHRLRGALSRPRRGRVPRRGALHRTGHRRRSRA